MDEQDARSLETAQEPQSQPEPAGADAQPAVEGKGFGLRAGAYILDAIPLFLEGFIVVAIGLLILGKPGLVGYAFYGAKMRGDSWAFGLSTFRGLAMTALYFSLFEWLYGATPAKLLLGLRVARVTGERCSLVGALIRGALRFVDGFFFAVPALVSMEPPLQQRIGDKAARTIVTGSREPWLRYHRAWWWLLVALGLYLLISIGSQMALIRYVDRDAALGDVYAEQATAAHTVNDHARAAELFEQAIEAGIPEDRLPNLYFLLGNQYYLLGDLDKAIQAQQQALEVDPEFYPAWRSLGTAYWLAGDLDRAEECSRQFIQLAPDRPEGYADLAWLHLERGNAVLALEWLDQALEIDPRSATAHAHAALAYALLGRFEQADASLRMARQNGYEGWQIIQEDIDSLKAGWQEP